MTAHDSYQTEDETVPSSSVSSNESSPSQENNLKADEEAQAPDQAEDNKADETTRDDDKGSCSDDEAGTSFRVRFIAGDVEDPRTSMQQAERSQRDASRRSIDSDSYSETEVDIAQPSSSSRFNAREYRERVARRPTPRTSIRADVVEKRRKWLFIKCVGILSLLFFSIFMATTFWAPARKPRPKRFDDDAYLNSPDEFGPIIVDGDETIPTSPPTPLRGLR